MEDSHGASVAIDIEAGLPHPEPSWKAAQDKLDALFAGLEGVDAPSGYTYSAFVDYVSDPAAASTEKAREHGDFAAAMACRSDSPGCQDSLRRVRQAIEKIVRPVGGQVYLADGKAFVFEALPLEFPELRVFNLTIPEAFSETEAPGFWVETVRFADLRSLARMRREIRRTGFRVGFAAHGDAVRLVSILLGLTAPAPAAPAAQPHVGEAGSRRSHTAAGSDSV